MGTQRNREALIAARVDNLREAAERTGRDYHETLRRVREVVLAHAGRTGRPLDDEVMRRARGAVREAFERAVEAKVFIS